MKSFFDPCINRVLELVDGQVLSVMRNFGSKPKVCRRNKIPQAAYKVGTETSYFVDGASRGRVWAKRVPVSHDLQIQQRTRHDDPPTRQPVSPPCPKPGHDYY